MSKSTPPSKPPATASSTPSRTDTEALWFVAYLDGDNTIQDKLCQSICGYILSDIGRSFGPTIAEDVLGEVLEKLFIHKAQDLYHQVKNRQIFSLRPWVKTVARRLALDIVKSGHYKAHLQSKQCEENTTDDYDKASNQEDYPTLSPLNQKTNPLLQMTEVDEPVLIIQAALAQLEPIQAKVVSYRLLEYKSSEICDILNITVEQEKYAKKQGLSHVIHCLIEAGYELQDFHINTNNKSALNEIKKNIQDNSLTPEDA